MFLTGLRRLLVALGILGALRVPVVALCVPTVATLGICSW